MWCGERRPRLAGPTYSEASSRGQGYGKEAWVESRRRSHGGRHDAHARVALACRANRRGGQAYPDEACAAGRVVARPDGRPAVRLPDANDSKAPNAFEARSDSKTRDDSEATYGSGGGRRSERNAAVAPRPRRGSSGANGVKGAPRSRES